MLKNVVESIEYDQVHNYTIVTKEVIVVCAISNFIAMQSIDFIL